jgi:hypothetical protein
LRVFNFRVFIRAEEVLLLPLIRLLADMNPETHNGVFAPDSWLSPASSAGAYVGGFAHHSDGDAGGAHDAWGAGVGWNDLIVGHGPGPGA